MESSNNQSTRDALAFHMPSFFRPDEPSVRLPVADFFHCSSPQYAIRAFLGQGTYGVVYLADDMKRKATVALKRFRLKDSQKPSSSDTRRARVDCDQAFFLSAIREISLLKPLKHDNIVVVRDVVFADDVIDRREEKYKQGGDVDDVPFYAFYAVMDYCIHDLESIIDHFGRKAKSPTLVHPFSIAQIKCILRQILLGVAYLHQHYVVHRDLKLSNVLMTDCGVVKIADFGMARKLAVVAQEDGNKCAENGNATPNVVTLWYRSPELLLGSTRHTFALDMWSVGCIMYELLSSGTPLFPGKDESHMVTLIVTCLGTPFREVAPTYEKLPRYAELISCDNNLNNVKFNSLRDRFRASVQEISPTGYSMLQKMLLYDEARRLTAEAAVASPYFTETPSACSAAMMPSFPRFKTIAQNVRN